jgi:hypothetical protein
LDGRGRRVGVALAMPDDAPDDDATLDVAVSEMPLDPLDSDVVFCSCKTSKKPGVGVAVGAKRSEVAVADSTTSSVCS